MSVQLPISRDPDAKKITRFPPEPNGYLHLGHLKAMLFDFELHNDGTQCILRLDDTNPETERAEYVDAIIEDVMWLGFKWHKITYTSDYFDQLYEFAMELVKRGKAYVDLTKPAEMKLQRYNRIESEFRSKPVEWHICEFELMKRGVYAENEAVLRLKIDMANDNPNLRDPIAYRIRHTPHYRTKDKYCIYPSYDYSHGIVDALENITDSYCTMEFFNRRDQYYWPVKELGLKAAEVREFGRLNIENVTLSKRKIVPLIADGTLSGFDDPRLYTIRGLRRRGFTPEILRKIVSKSTMERHEACLSKAMIDFELRDVLNKVSPRAFAVMDPIELVICDNVFTDRDVSHPNHPNNKELGSHITKFTKSIFIDSADFRLVDSPDYYRLALNKIVRLRYADFIRCDSVSNECKLSILASTAKPVQPKKVKGIIHWVSSCSPSALFEVHEDLYAKGGELVNSVKKFRGNVEKFVMDMLNRAPDTIFQFERLGYFKLDRYDTTTQLPVFMRVIELVDKFNL